MSDHRLLELIDLVYAAPGSHAGWVTFLDRLRTALHGATANFIRHDLRQRRGDMLVTSGSDPEGTRQYLEQWSHVDPWAYSPRHAALAHKAVILGDDLVAHGDLQRTAFYNDFARHYDLVRIVGGVVEAGQDASSVLSVSRSEHQQPFAAPEARLLEALVPHIRQAVMLHQRLAASEAVAASLTEVVNRSPAAMLFVNARGEVTFINEAGARLVATRDGLILERGELRAEHPADTRQLRECIGAAANLHVFRAGMTAVAIRRPSGKRPLTALICPLVRPGRWLMPDATVATIVIGDPERRPVLDARLLRQLYGLTPAEAKLASLLATGLTPHEAASALHVTRNTVRTQLKALFQKTGTHRQPDLVRVLLQDGLYHHEDR